MSSYTIKVEGLSVHITESTSGNSAADNFALIFLHGLSLDSRVWRHQHNAPVLSDYKKIAIDLPGHGQSDWSSEPLSFYSLDEIGKTIQKIVKEIGIEDFVLIGSSLGANVALHSIELLTGCRGVLAITAPLTKPLETSVFTDPDFLISKVYQEVLANDTMERFSRLLFRPAAEIPIFVQNAIKISDPKFRSALIAFIGQGNYHDEWELINRNSHIPVGLVIGDLDQFYNFTYLRNMEASSVWRGSVQWISNAGHLPQWDNPDEFNTLLFNFIEDIRSLRGKL